MFARVNLYRWYADDTTPEDVDGIDIHRGPYMIKFLPLHFLDNAALVAADPT